MTTAPAHADAQRVAQDVQHWLEQVVLGLGLCPFAARLDLSAQVRIRVTDVCTKDALIKVLRVELGHLDQTNADELETTLIAVPEMLGDFMDFNDFQDDVDAILRQDDWGGVFQVATFHPDYRFADTEPDEIGNYTNRSPWPLLHLLREDRVEAALASWPNPEAIPKRNIQVLRALSPTDRAQLWPRLNQGGN